MTTFYTTHLQPTYPLSMRRTMSIPPLQLKPRSSRPSKTLPPQPSGLSAEERIRITKAARRATPMNEHLLRSFVWRYYRSQPAYSVSSSVCFIYNQLTYDTRLVITYRSAKWIRMVAGNILLCKNLCWPSVLMACNVARRTACSMVIRWLSGGTVSAIQPTIVR